MKKEATNMSWQHKRMTKLAQNGKHSTQPRGNAAHCFLAVTIPSTLCCGTPKKL
jgi:hypothetical protein